MDKVSHIVRSRIMASVGTKNTGPEIVLRKALYRLGFRFRLHDRGLPGSPDIVLPKFRTAIFVHGCFWHAHGCSLSSTPSTRREFWREKFEANRRRDERKTEQLLAAGWRVIAVWQCALESSTKSAHFLAERIVKWLGGRQKFVEIPAFILKPRRPRKY
jgi:DNA mismatch endonuclease (patch repair protein)